MNNKYIQEAVELSRGIDFMPTRLRFKLPNVQNGNTVFLLSNSYEYDIEIIKSLPSPKVYYKNIIIPFKIMDKIGVKPFRYIMSINEYTEKVLYLDKQRLMPRIIPIRYPYPSTFQSNIFVPMSELIKFTTPFLRQFNVQYMKENIFDLFTKIMKNFNFSKNNIIIVDTSKFRIYKNVTSEIFKTDLINALLGAFILCSDKDIKRLPYTFIFKTPDADYKFELSKWDRRDMPRLRNMLNKIGTSTLNEEESMDDFEINYDESEDTEEDDFESSISKLTEDEVPTEEELSEDETEDVKNIQSVNSNSTSKLTASLDAISSKYAVQQTSKDEDILDDSKLYKAKTVDIGVKLINKINPTIGDSTISNYKKIESELTKDDGNDVVEKQIMSNISKSISKTSTPVDSHAVNAAITSQREMKMRKQMGEIKLNNVTFDTLKSITDTPIPQAVVPNKTTTTNAGVLKGSGFINIANEYEEKLLDRDIVSTFMNLSELPNGYFVTKVDVTDISNATSLMNNWKVTLKNKETQLQTVINVKIPIIKNGRFLYNGTWYNIQKQDFPIPILKVSKNKVMITSNYQKITVERYDTKSLVDVAMFVKIITKLGKSQTENPYVKVGSNIGSNGSFVSTIEFDDYAKRWDRFINKEARCEIYFNRQLCLKKYNFVSVSDSEFCCGMLNDVPIVINTDTGLTRDGKTLTDTMLKTLPMEIQSEYSRSKPGKLSMYSQIDIGGNVPLGIAIAAWEGLSSLIKRSNVNAKIVDKNFAEDGFILIPFKDKALAIPNGIQSQLIYNGFHRINTKNYSISDFETPITNPNSIYVDIFNQYFFTQYSKLTLFIAYYNFFVDVITKDVCLHYNIPDNICDMLIYASNMLADNGFTSEQNAALYRIRSSEIIPAILHYRLAFALSKYNNRLGSKTKGNKIQFNPNEVIYDLTTTNTVSPLSALNPYVELHGRETISKKGFKGQNSDRSYSLDKRAYDPSMIGKIGISSPNNAAVGVNRQLVVDPKIESVRGYTKASSDESNSDIQLSSFSELLTPGTITRDDAIRNAIATSQTSHIMPTINSQPVLISNGVDEITPACVTDEFCVMAKEDGLVIDMNEEYMIVQYKSNKKQAVPIGHRQSFNASSGFNVDNKLTPNFKVNDHFKKNDILAYHENFFSKDVDGVVRMNIGPLAKVAFTGTYSTYEDAGLVTTKFSKQLGSKYSMVQQIKINATDDIDYIVKVGDEVEILDPLIKFGLGDTGDKSVDNFLKAFQTKDGSSSILDTAKKSINAKSAGRIADIKIYTCKSLDKLSPSLYEIVSNHFKENLKRKKILDKHDKSSSTWKLDTAYTRPTEPLPGPTIKAITTDVLIEIFIEHTDEQSVGSKLVAYGAMKQITSEVVPEGLEPYAESTPNEEISMFVCPSSTMKRMVPSIIINSAGNKVLIELKKKIRNIWES